MNLNATVGGYGNLKVTLQQTHDLGTLADILITFPKWDYQSSQFEPILSYVFNGICGIIDSQESNINSGASCEFKSGTSTDTVRIKNALRSGRTAASPVIFIVGEIRNPSSLRGISNIKVQI